MTLNKQLFFGYVVALTLCSCSNTVSQADFAVIPAPYEVSVDTLQRPFTLTSSSTVSYPDGDSVLMRQAHLLAGYVEDNTGIKLKVESGDNGDIALLRNLSDENREAYMINVTPSAIVVNGATEAGSFYGIQTLRKAIPTAKAKSVSFPAATVYDAPRFGYRGAHLDVSRHFFPTDSVKEFIDMLALHNINTFHWHLTDHQGWRAEIKSRPLLTEVGARRPHTIVGKSRTEYDSIPVEGYYTQEQMREIVRYAAERNINVIPEIDLPGHFMAGLAAYPELGCTGGPYEVFCAWENSPLDVLCAGNPAVYDFLDDVFGELVEIFPSQLFHIGGDECPKARWKDCLRCQAEADRLGFHDDARGTREAKLQNHIMHHVTDFLKKHGRRVIGWDEILDSDFDTTAVVMGWRGESGGLRGAQRGHDVIMTPGIYLYFDFYQSTDQASEPLAIGGYVPVQKVYSYNVIPEGLSEAESKHILGAQANLWTEYIPTFSQVMYMELPRIAALAETTWSRPEKKDFKNFVNRLPRLLDIYKANGWPYAGHVFDVNSSITPDVDAKALKVSLSTYDGAPVRYTLDGSEPSGSSAVFSDTLVVDSPVVLKARAERDGVLGRVYNAGIQFSKATFKPAQVAPAPHPRYTYNGARQLTDACLASAGYTDENWLGFNSPVVTFDIDLEDASTVSKAGLRVNVNTDAWIFDVRNVKVEVSVDGKDYKEVYSQTFEPLDGNTSAVRQHDFAFEPVEARFVRMIVSSESSMPVWHAGAGNQAFLFVDELTVE